jgi:hypothetical protein
MLAVVVKKQGFSTAFAFVIAAAYANGIDPTPVTFGLRVHIWIAIHLTGGGLEYSGIYPFGQAQHVDGTENTGFGGLYRVVLVMHGACRTSQIKDAVYLHIKRKGDIVAHQLKVGLAQQVPHIGFTARKEVVYTQHLFTTGNEAVAQVGAEESGTAGDKGTGASGVIFHFLNR